MKKLLENQELLKMIQSYQQCNNAICKFKQNK